MVLSSDQRMFMLIPLMFWVLKNKSFQKTQALQQQKTNITNLITGIAGATRQYLTERSKEINVLTRVNSCVNAD